MPDTTFSGQSVAVDCSVFDYGHGGIASFFRPFLLRLLGEYPQVRFYLVAPESADLSFVERAGNAVPVRYDDSRPLWLGMGKSLRRVLTLSTKLRQVKADALLSPYYAFFIPPRYRNRSVITVHDTCFWDVPQYYSRKNRMLHKAFMAWNVFFAKTVLTVSETSKIRLLRNIRGLSLEAVRVVYNAWEGSPSGVSQCPASDSRLADVLRYAPERLFLCSGGYSGTKNLDTVLSALKSVVGERGDIGLVLTGNARYEGDLWRKLDCLDLYGHVFPTGVVSPAEMLWLLRERCSAGICMSVYEGFGRSVVEAMQAGLPLICSDIPSNREIAGDYPAAYCGVHDTEALGRAILAVAKIHRCPPAFDGRFSMERNWKTFASNFQAVLAAVSGRDV